MVMLKNALKTLVKNKKKLLKIKLFKLLKN